MAAVYGRWLRRTDMEPDAQATNVYADEWKALAAQVETVDTVDEGPDDGMDASGDDGSGDAVDGDEGGMKAIFEPPVPARIPPRRPMK